ncbi:MAG TPA: ATP-binding protein [Pseudomonadales bacterium]|nr:ATP-binding protein [Pseudomonadales bacterium]
MSLSPSELKEVRATPLFANLTDDKQECIDSLKNGEIMTAAPGTVLAIEDECSGFFHVLLEGEVRITRDYDNQTILMRTLKGAGSYFGEIMLLLDIPWLSTVRVTKPARLFRLDEPGFWRMMTLCHDISRDVFRSAATRMRNVEGYTQQREKLASLGTMAAGLAHELNNPAAAARRAAAHLGETANKAQSYLCQLSRCLELEHWQHLLNTELQANEKLAKAPVLNNLERSDREDEIAQWLEARGVAFAWDLAPTFVSADMDTAFLGEVVEKLPDACRANAIGWLESRLNLKLLTAQVEQSTNRIVELVKAIKSYSYMDQAPVQEVDVHEGIESTLTMLGYKLRNVTVERSFDRSIPRIAAYGSELNQVWTNLIDNAIDAVNGSGKICIGTFKDDDQVVVEIVDNGPGIPAEVQSHMFEPFFTTKSVGSGTGLGLIICNRIVGDRHGGEIEFESKPGETRFKVRLPIGRKPSDSN